MRRVSEVAKQLGMSPMAIWRLVYSGRLAFVKIGRSVRLRDEDVADFVRANTHMHASSEKPAPRRKLATAAK